jgi:hypothetical protein
MAGTSALQELDPMVEDPVVMEASSPVEPAELEAASKAVRDVPAHVMKLGGTKEQAEALAEAMRLVLLGHSMAARSVLEAARYPAPAIDEIMRHLERGLKSAA